jgi:hypothetical protein
VSRPSKPSPFQMLTTSFWNTAETSGRPYPVLSPETSRGEMTSLGVATGVPRPGRTLSWEGEEAGTARTGCRQSCRPCRSRNPAVMSPAGLRPLSDQRPLELRRGTQHVDFIPAGTAFARVVSANTTLSVLVGPAIHE